MEKTKPLVSICCQVYNHEKFIDQTISGFQNQITDFNFEIIICDDASTDASKEIITNYAKLDSRIKPIFQEENKFSKNERILYKYIYPKCIGRYIAVCDGDDYWTDPLKLQKQVDFLENNNDYGIVGARMLSYYEADDEFVDWSHPKNNNDLLNIKDLAQGNFIFSSSVLIRNDFIIEEWWDELPFCDWPMYLLQINDKKIKILDEITGVYRIHSKGMFSSISKQKQLVNEINCINVLLIYSELGVEVKSILGNSLMKKVKLLEEDCIRYSNKYKNEKLELKSNINIKKNKLNMIKENLYLFIKKLKSIFI